ncbi:MAG: ECF-type sigma factor [Gemmatimonadaceae bacterium]
MSIHDTATALDVAPATVTRGWAMAKAWLYRDMQRSLEDTR